MEQERGTVAGCWSGGSWLGLLEARGVKAKQQFMSGAVKVPLYRMAREMLKPAAMRPKARRWWELR